MLLTTKWGCGSYLFFLEQSETFGSEVQVISNSASTPSIIALAIPFIQWFFFFYLSLEL